MAVKIYIKSIIFSYVKRKARDKHRVIFRLGVGMSFEHITVYTIDAIKLFPGVFFKTCLSCCSIKDTQSSKC
jgi:hypothetical protein